MVALLGRPVKIKGESALAPSVNSDSLPRFLKMRIVSTQEASCLADAAALIKSGGLVAFPTDTLYGLGAAASDDAAVRRLFAVKGRPLDKALPLLLTDVSMVDEVSADIPALGRALMTRFWPGALTIVLFRKPEFHSLALAGGDTVAVRVPDHDLVRELIRRIAAPLTGTSANRSGGPSPLTAQQVAEQLGGKIDLVLDAGPCQGGVESTVIDMTAGEPRLLRAGAIAWEAIKDVAAQARSI